MARPSREAVAVVLCAALGCGAAAARSGQTQEQRRADTVEEAAPDTRLLADLEILRDLELLRQLDVLRKVDEARGTPGPRAPREEKGKP